ncbi:hypothetical protein PGTUg99_023946 [Puccinia graminis f. sp. tritici]|uniref:Uncharacterized protein n=1 Tax=Puccinia graminis f. sp. tritici TaxID=56615 RepID=A0A5B0SCL5_PUCGR|nr:hypothetical protein PGTUg99_023946 [Puccinia graminis f. sp. tritici]
MADGGVELSERGATPLTVYGSELQLLWSMCSPGWGHQMTSSSNWQWNAQPGQSFLRIIQPCVIVVIIIIISRFYNNRAKLAAKVTAYLMRLEM